MDVLAFLVVFAVVKPLTFVTFLFFIGITAYAIYAVLRRRWVRAGPSRRGERIAIVMAGALVMSAPYLVYKAHELAFVLGRVPEPLHVAWIEYRREQTLGLGPGGNETGYVVYRLTRDSAQWARSQRSHLIERLPGRETTWHATPVLGGDAWRGSNNRPAPQGGKPNLDNYLNRYGSSISVESGPAEEFDRAVQQPGSFYAYSAGGAVTVVDPQHGKVYFAYAG